MSDGDEGRTPSGEVEAVLEAAARLVSAFGEHRVEDYFACFAPGATFVFHNAPTRLGSRDSYRRLWERWEQEDGFRVLGCRSTDAQVQLLGAVAVLTHDVRTAVRTDAGEDVLLERETIVFQREHDGRWVAVHEHLSPAPQQPVQHPAEDEAQAARPRPGGTST